MRVFAPLGMRRTAFTLAEAQGLAGAQLAMPHGEDDEDEPRPIGHYGVAEWPAAQLRSSAADLARFLLGFTNPRQRLLSDASTADMFPPDFKRGLAWCGKDAWYGRVDEEVWVHGGCMDGVRAEMCLWPEQKSGPVVLMNAGELADGEPQKLSRIIERLLFRGAFDAAGAPQEKAAGDGDGRHRDGTQVNGKRTAPSLPGSLDPAKRLRAHK